MADETANESCFVRSLINFPRRAINRPNKYIYIYISTPLSTPSTSFRGWRQRDGRFRDLFLTLTALVPRLPSIIRNEIERILRSNTKCIKTHDACVIVYPSSRLQHRPLEGTAGYRYCRRKSAGKEFRTGCNETTLAANYTRHLPRV